MSMKSWKTHVNVKTQRQISHCSVAMHGAAGPEMIFPPPGASPEPRVHLSSSDPPGELRRRHGQERVADRRELPLALGGPRAQETIQKEADGQEGVEEQFLNPFSATQSHDDKSQVRPASSNTLGIKLTGQSALRVAMACDVIERR